MRDDFTEFRDALWLAATEDPDCGLTLQQLAALVGKHASHVGRCLKRARIAQHERGPIQLLEVMAMTPANGCDRHCEIKRGDRKICLNCGMSAPFMPPAPLAPGAPMTMDEARAEADKAKSRKPAPNVVYHQRVG